MHVKYQRINSGSRAWDRQKKYYDRTVVVQNKSNLELKDYFYKHTNIIASCNKNQNRNYLEKLLKCHAARLKEKDTNN
jgi:hypothetical protein